MSCSGLGHRTIWRYMMLQKISQKCFPRFPQQKLWRRYRYQKDKSLPPCWRHSHPNSSLTHTGSTWDHILYNEKKKKKRKKERGKKKTVSPEAFCIVNFLRVVKQRLRSQGYWYSGLQFVVWTTSCSPLIVSLRVEAWQDLACVTGVWKKSL